MKPQLVRRLVALNQAFYTRFAGAFSETRSSAQSSLNKIVTYISPGVKVLDVGCGNGRMARRLDQAGLRVDYLGVDFSQALVALAAARCAGLRYVEAHFYVADITRPHWYEQEGQAQGGQARGGQAQGGQARGGQARGGQARGGQAQGGQARGLPLRAPFDVALALAVLHHIPSFDLRREVLRSIGAVLRPGGALIMTNWQFIVNERLRNKIVPWAAIGIDENDLEPGDALLDWRRGGTGYRYCHLLTETEAQDLAAQSGFEIVEQFSADADLNLYSVLRKVEGGR